jgi:tetratricopeptide (TPR) repeat protein
VKLTDAQLPAEAAGKQTLALKAAGAGGEATTHEAARNLVPFSGWDRALALLLICATLLAYFPALRGGFVWDDEAHIRPVGIGSLSNLPEIWLRPGATQQYYPLVFTMFLLERRLWGDATLGYHLVNVLLHCVSALLFLKILRQLEIPGAWLAAAVFALHPVHVESVAWMTELKNTLSGVLYLSSALLYFRFDQTRAKVWYFPAWGLFVLGLTAKTAIATLPAGLLVVIWWKRGRISWKSDVMPLLPFFLAAVAAGILTAHIEQKLFGAQGWQFDYSTLERCLIAGRSLWFHLGKLFWPVGLAFMYPHWEISRSVWWQYLFPAAALALAAICWALRRWSRGPLAALLLFAGTLFPALGFFNAYSFRYCFVNDHHQYLASLGIITLMAGAAALLVPHSRSWERLASTVACLVLLIALAGLTWKQSGTYKDAETLWRATLAANPKAFLAHNNLGTLLLANGHVGEARMHFLAAQAIKPDFAETHSNLGNLLLQDGRLDEAIAQFQEAVRLEPRLASAQSNLGVALLRKGLTPEAITQLRTAVAKCPNVSEILNNLGNALRQSGDLGAALGCYRKALEIQPGNVTAWCNLAGTLTLQGQAPAAADAFQRALDFEPNLAEAHRGLARILLHERRPREGIAHLQQAVQLQPDLADARDELGTALLGNGQIEEAIAQFQSAVQIAPGFAAARSNLGNALLRASRAEEALAQYQAALGIEPANPYLLNNVAWLLATCTNALVRDGARAVDAAQRAERLSRDQDPRILGTLAAAYAETGRFPDAITAAQRALELATAQTNSAQVETLRTHIRLYQVGTPVRDAGQGTATGISPN